MYRQFAVVLIGALLIFAAACGSDSPSGPEDQGEPTSSLECSAPALAATEAVPFSRVTLTGVSGIDQDTWVDYETESGTQGMTVVLPKEGGGFEIVVPAHPDQLMAGGAINFVVDLSNVTFLDSAGMAVLVVLRGAITGCTGGSCSLESTGDSLSFEDSPEMSCVKLIF